MKYINKTLFIFLLCTFILSCEKADKPISLQDSGKWLFKSTSYTLLDEDGNSIDRDRITSIMDQNIRDKWNIHPDLFQGATRSLLLFDSLTFVNTNKLSIKLRKADERFEFSYKIENNNHLIIDFDDREQQLQLTEAFLGRELTEKEHAEMVAEDYFNFIQTETELTMTRKRQIKYWKNFAMKYPENAKFEVEKWTLQK